MRNIYYLYNKNSEACSSQQTRKRERERGGKMIIGEMQKKGTRKRWIEEGLSWESEGCEEEASEQSK